MRSRLLALALLPMGLLVACETPAMPIDGGTDAMVAPPPRVTLPEGEVVGSRGAGFVNYLGIPYAEPPVGPLRFAPPVAHGPFDGPIGPVRSPASCPQTALGLAGGEEDCLVVNVHVPATTPTNAPVLVWIHGGAFLVGSGISLDRVTLGDFIAREQNVIVVSMNYRLGPFGFFRHPGVAEGNQGFRDQQLALRWVRDHIAAFGGDPANVTIFGESAGGNSVCLHLVAPESRGLFVRAIAQSGLCDSYLATVAEAETGGASLVEALGCTAAPDVATCVRAASIDALFAAAGPAAELSGLLSGTDFRPFWPVVDGVIIPRTFREAVLAGEFANVPTIIGWNRDEGTLFVGLAEMSGTVADMAAYDRAIDSLSTRHSVAPADVRAAYPVSSYPDVGAAIADMQGDAELICPSRRAARLLSDAGVDVHVYRFDYDMARFQLNLPRMLGAFHSAEIQFVFGHPVGMTGFTGPLETLQTSMQGAWAAFARGEDPATAAGVPWVSFDSSAEGAVVFDEANMPATALDRESCSLWDP